MRMEGGIAVEADFRVLYFHGLDERFYRIAVRGREENNLLIDNLVTLITDL